MPTTLIPHEQDPAESVHDFFAKILPVLQQDGSVCVRLRGVDLVLTVQLSIVAAELLDHIQPPVH
jgi:hypothetical protein